MTIASAFNEIAMANGGTADNSGTIAGTVDALTDALAGSDVAQGATIEDGVRVLGEYISGGGGADLGEIVLVKASENKDFGFELWIGDNFAASMYADAGGVGVAAGASVYIASTESGSGTYKIGSAAPQNLVFKTVGSTGYLTFTIPADTPKGTEIIVDGKF